MLLSCEEGDVEGEEEEIAAKWMEVKAIRPRDARSYVRKRTRSAVRTARLPIP